MSRYLGHHRFWDLFIICYSPSFATPTTVLVNIGTHFSLAVSSTSNSLHFIPSITPSFPFPYDIRNDFSYDFCFCPWPPKWIQMWESTPNAIDINNVQPVFAFFFLPLHPTPPCTSPPPDTTILRSPARNKLLVMSQKHFCTSPSSKRDPRSVQIATLPISFKLSAKEKARTYQNRV